MSLMIQIGHRDEAVMLSVFEPNTNSQTVNVLWLLSSGLTLDTVVWHLPFSLKYGIQIKYTNT